MPQDALKSTGTERGGERAGARGPEGSEGAGKGKDVKFEIIGEWQGVVKREAVDVDVEIDTLASSNAPISVTNSRPASSNVSVIGGRNKRDGALSNMVYPGFSGDVKTSDSTVVARSPTKTNKDGGKSEGVVYKSAKAGETSDQVSTKQSSHVMVNSGGKTKTPNVILPSSNRSKTQELPSSQIARESGKMLLAEVERKKSSAVERGGMSDQNDNVKQGGVVGSPRLAGERARHGDAMDTG